LWYWLEDRRSKDNKMSREIWKVVETKAGKTIVAEKTKEEEKNRNKKSSKRIEDLEWREGSSKIKRKS